MQQRLPTITFFEEGNSQFPLLRSLYDFYSPRCKKIVIWSYGMGHLGVESQLVEGLGAHVYIFDSREGARERFDLCDTIVKSHKVNDESVPWQKNLAAKWILPNRLHFSDILPFTFSGKLDQNNLQAFDLSGTPQVDIVKVDYSSFTHTIIYSLLNAGYRPGLFLVHWEKHPDEFQDSMICAGHLQNTGYILLGVKENWFLYLYVDQNIYEACSWARTDVANPLLEEYKLSFLGISNQPVQGTG